MSSGIPLLGVNEGREENGVSDEEDGCVVAYQVPVAFFCVQLYGKSTWIPKVTYKQ